MREGYRHAEVEARVDTSADRPHVAVTIAIQAGPPTMVRRATYAGLDSLPLQHRSQLIAGSSLVSDQTLETRRFSELDLLDERRFLLNSLRNLGYAAVTRDSITAHCDSGIGRFI